MAAAASAIRETVSNVVSNSDRVTGVSGLTDKFTGSVIASDALHSFSHSLQEQLALATDVFDELAAGLKQVVLKYQPGSDESAASGNGSGNPAPPPALGAPTARVERPEERHDNQRVRSRTVPHRALVPISGDHGALTRLARTYLDSAEQFQSASGTVKSIKNNLSATWESAGSPSHEHALEVALDRSQYAAEGLDGAAHALYRYAGELAVAQDAHSRAVAQVASLQAELVADPTNFAPATQLRHHLQIAFNAQAQAAQAANTFAAAMQSCTATRWYQIPPLTSRFGAVTAAVLESLVSHRWMSSNDAYLVAQQLESLSASDYQTFMKVVEAANSDAQRGNLYKTLAGGQPISTSAEPHLAPVAIKPGAEPTNVPPKL